MIVRVNGRTAFVEADIGVYSLLALKKAAYRLANRCTVVFGPLEGSRLHLEFSCTHAQSENDVQQAVHQFFEEALDYDLRERLSAETAPLRNLILAHAFSRTKLVQSSDE